MAYAEKRGDHWRGRYRNAPGLLPKWPSVSEDKDGYPFTSKQAALDAAHDKEAEIRRAGSAWKDPRKAEVHLGDWIRDVWWDAQDLEENTEVNYSYLLRHHIILEFGERPINTFTSPEEINAWQIRNRKGFAPSTAGSARSLLSTILSDAKRAGLLEVNVAEKTRNRGRKSARKKSSAPAPEKIWPTPLETLLGAERAALLSGRDDEFILVVTIGWTGKRWGEAIGLEDNDVLKARIALESQLAEIKGRFSKIPPKDDSRRRVDTPPFLSRLLARQMLNRATGKCSCQNGRCKGSGRFLFLSPGKTSPKTGKQYRLPSHPTRSNFGKWYWHPAFDGFYPEEGSKGGQRPRPARPVLVDGVTGRPLRPAWHYAIPGMDFHAPRGHGWTRFDLDEGLGLASWLPIKLGLTPHGLRHGHQTWMAEDRVELVLRAERLGHTLSGIQEHYTHISDRMRAELMEALERRWEQALDERIAIDLKAGRLPGSHVGVLNELLIARWERANKIISQTSPNHQEGPIQRGVGQSL